MACSYRFHFIYVVFCPTCFHAFLAYVQWIKIVKDCLPKYHVYYCEHYENKFEMFAATIKLEKVLHKLTCVCHPHLTTQYSLLKKLTIHRKHLGRNFKEIAS